MATDGGTPWIVRAFFNLLIPAEIREEAVGDLEEGFKRVERTHGRSAARRWAWRQLLTLNPLALRRALRASERASAAKRGSDNAARGLGGIVVDCKHAIRAVRARPGASFMVAATVALALGATTAVFSVVNGVLLTPLPYPEPDGLVRVWQTKGDWVDSPNHQLRSFALRFPLSMPTFNDWLAVDLGFQALGAHTGARFVSQESDGAEIIPGEHVTSGVMEAMGVPPALGRGLMPEDDEVGAPRVALLSHGLWRERFGGRSDVLGESMSLDGEPHTIVGVMPRGFRSLNDDARLWAPLPDDAKADDRDSQYLSVLGRLAPGVTRATADSRIATVQARLADEYPETQGDVGSRTMSLLDWVVGDVRSTLWFLFGSVALVLLIASANIANILSVVGLTRRREMAVKAALGASTGRLLRGLFVETVLLAGIGGLGGIFLAWASLPLLLRLLPPSVPRSTEVGMDGTVLLFGLGLTVVTAVLVGILPALQAARTNPQEMIRESGGGTAGDRSGRRVRSVLVMAEVALAFVLLVGAGLLGISFMQLWSVDRGFATESLVVLAAEPDPAVYSEEEDRDRFVRDLRRELEAIPGVAVSATNQVPLSGSMSTTSYEVERSDAEPDDASLVISVVLENYLDVMEIPLLAGRGFARTDDKESPEVAIVSQRLADAMWPGESPVGKRLRPAEGAEWTTVVGLARDVRHSGLAVEAEPKLYVPVWQNRRHPTQWVLRARGNVDGVMELAREAVRAVSPTTPVRSLDLIEERITRSVAVPRFRTLFVVGLAGMAGLLALLGVYGVVTFSVMQRTREIGVRMALGARADHVVRQVVGSGLKLAAGGIVTGGLVALAAADTVAEFTFGIEVTDPRIYLGIAVGVAVVSCAAAYLPARRAAKVDPMAVLKSD